MTYLRIKNWEKFQHFKDRRPPWIKLYRDIMDDVEWHELKSSHAKALISFWLIASENEGNLPDVRTLAFRLRCSESAITEHLRALSHWLIQDDIGMISDGYQGDTPERERETEREIETEEDTCPEPLGDSDPEIGIGIPLIPSEGEYQIRQSEHDEWQTLYPGVDVEQTLREIRAWNLANPTRRKTRKGVLRHINAWMNKEQCKA